MVENEALDLDGVAARLRGERFERRSSPWLKKLLAWSPSWSSSGLDGAARAP